MFLTNWLRPRPAKAPRSSAPRPRLGVYQLEDRTTPSTLAQMGGAGNEMVASQVMDASGNSYVTGIFDQAADFDPGSGTTPWMVPQGTGNDEFVAKYTADGALAWARRFGGSQGDLGNVSMAVDSSGNTYVSGSFTGTADFGNNILLTAVSGGNAFVLKLDPTGSTAWVRTAGGTGSSQAPGVAVDGNSVYATGSFTGQVDFDPTRSYADNHDLLTSTLYTNKSPSQDTFVWRLTSAGDFVSAWGFGGVNGDYGKSVYAANGSVYVHGYFSGTTDFDPSPSKTFNVTSGPKTGSAYPMALFVTRYTPDAAGGLTLNWVQTIGGSNVNTTVFNHRLAGDASALYVPGNFSGTVDFDRNHAVSTDTLSSVAGSTDAFVAKYNLADGSLAWVRSIGGPGVDDAGPSVVVDAGMVYVGGTFQQTADFDPATSYPDNRDKLTTAGSADGFTWQLTGGGAYVNAWRVGGAGSDRSRPIGVYGGRLYSAGSFEQTADFPTGGTLTSSGAGDLYLMVLDLSPRVGAFTASATSVPSGGSVTLTASGVTDTNAGATVTQVAFYYLDANGAAQPLGDGTRNADGTWTLTLTVTLPPGSYTLLAQATDSLGVTGAPLALALLVG